jgi:5-hydroxyisourate hydrolase-like protein (transthyretin family)
MLHHLVYRLSIAFVAWTLLQVTSAFAQSSGEGTILSLQDFTAQETKGAGLTLTHDMRVHVTALGGGDRRFWNGLFENWFDDDEENHMFASGWIIDAQTRQPVWEMTMENTKGRDDHRKFDDDIALKKGSYEVYFSAHSYYESRARSSFSINIDRREKPATSRRARSDFRDDDSYGTRDLYEDFMELAKDYGITLSTSDGDASGVQRFEPPMNSKEVLFKATKLGDRAFVRQGLSVSKEVPLRIYALGEGRRRDEMFDYGWIVNSATRERVWEMRYRNSSRGGGAAKDLRFDGTVTLPKGNYDLYYITDDSHSYEDWNATPPYDPYNYGITVMYKDDADRGAVKLVDASSVDKNVVVQLTRVENGDFKSSGFTLKGDTKLHVYAIGEGVDDHREMADYGWIIDAKTRDRVWSMDRRHTYHAGGATKNRLVDEIITLPKGKYLAYYTTDDSHAYDDWNDDPPFDPEHWGLTVMGAGESFDAKSVATFSEDKEEGVIAQIIRVGDHRHQHETFTLAQATNVRVYALGEGQDRRMYDYGWIEDVKTGRTVWEMTYRMTTGAGGAQKNRMVDTKIQLDKGDYEVHYRTDDSHSFNDWNADPPEDRMHWGITLYKEQ